MDEVVVFVLYLVFDEVLFIIGMIYLIDGGWLN